MLHNIERVVALKVYISEATPELGMSIGLEFQINMYAVSGLKVDSLRLFHEGYKPYKVNYQWGVCVRT